jgi:hypothetical protein
MFVIFGTRAKTRETGRGQFYCPSCKTTRLYIQKESAQYFALYFIPLFRVDSPKIYVECQACRNAFKPEVLHMDANRMQVSALLAGAEKEMRAGTPSHIIYHKLLAQKIPDNLAKPLSLAMLGPRPKICKSCASLYCQQVPSCTNCGGELVDNQDPAFWEQKKTADQLYVQVVQNESGL